MELKLGTRITFEGIKLKAWIDYAGGCANCWFVDKQCEKLRDITGECEGDVRSDGVTICFSKI